MDSAAAESFVVVFSIVRVSPPGSKKLLALRSMNSLSNRWLIGACSEVFYTAKTLEVRIFMISEPARTPVRPARSREYP